MSYISQWHIFISGLTENRKQSTGLQKAWLSTKVHKQSPEAFKKVQASLSTVFFPVLPWNYDWYTLARFVQINSQPEVFNFSPNPPLINIYGYSWGAGHGAIQLATHLQNVGNYEVQNMVLADPVYCSPCFLMRWRAIFSDRWSCTRRFTPKIVIPSNVLNVFWSRQYNNWPRAHSLYLLPTAKTVIHPPQLELYLIHAEMDESEWFQDKVSLLASGSSVA